MHIVHLRFAWAFDTDTDMDTDMYMDTRQELSDYQTRDESWGTAPCLRELNKIFPRQSQRINFLNNNSIEKNLKFLISKHVWTKNPSANQDSKKVDKWPFFFRPPDFRHEITQLFEYNRKYMFYKLESF